MTHTDILSAVESLIAELEAAQARIEELEAENEELANENEELQERVAELEAENEELANENANDEVEASLSEKVEELKRDCRRTIERYYDLEDENKRLRSDYDNAARQLRNMTSHSLKLKKCLDSLNNTDSVNVEQLRNSIIRYSERAVDENYRNNAALLIMRLGSAPTLQQLINIMCWCDEPRFTGETDALYTIRKTAYENALC